MAVEMSARAWREILLDPGVKCGPRKGAGSERKKGAFGIVDGRRELESVEEQERFEGSVPDAFVAIDERMVANQGEGERCAFLGDGRVEVSAVECGARLSDGGLERTDVTKAGGAAGLRDDALVEKENFSERQVAHFGVRAVLG
jgi:hypothetical protein